MHRLLARTMVALALTIATLAAPTATVHACSCMAFTLADAIEAADLAFIGTVADAARGGKDPTSDMELVRYAFEVERASQATGPLIEVVSHDDPGGASCGFSFGVGERWFVAAASDGGLLRSTLCSGNRLIDDLGAGEMDEIAALLPAEPVAESPVSPPSPDLTPAGGFDAAVTGAIVVGLVAALALALVIVAALRRRSS